VTRPAVRDPSRALVGAIVFAVAVAAFSRVPLLPDIGADLSLTAGEIGLLTTAFGCGRLLMDLPAGRLAGAADPPVALGGAGLALAVSCAVLAASQTLLQALVGSALIGSASALTNTVGMYAFATATGAERRGASMAMYVTALMSGQMVGPTLGGAIGSLAGWRPALAVAAAIGVLVALGAAGWRRWQRGHSAARRARPEPRADPPPAAGPHASRSELAALAAAPFATFFGMAGLTQTLIPLIGDEQLGLSASAIGVAIGAGAALRFAGAWATGIASDRLSRKLILVPSLVTMALGAAVLAVSAGALGWGASIGLVALGSSGISVAAAAVADRVPAQRLGQELGLFRLLGDLGLVIGPAVAGFAYQASGPALAAALSAGVFTVAALAAALWVSGGPPPAPTGDDTGELALG
jgi:DHA1 family multidrug resistance protein-like MFS transporter